MIAKHQVVIRPAYPSDSHQIKQLTQFSPFVHQHLDWCKPTDWIGQSPFLVVERNYQLIAALACPPNPQGVAWLRFFAVDSRIPLQDAWSELWTGVNDQLSVISAEAVAIPYHQWFQEILAKSQFENIEDVVMLQWNQNLLPAFSRSDKFQIRRMKSEDIPYVHQVDSQAFEPIWQNSGPLLEIALSKSAIATVAEKSGEIVGYQMSTANTSSGHLARLAVLPRIQGLGVGTALVRDLLNQFQLWGTLRVTVNTQKENVASLALYEKIGFNRTKEIYPVYRCNP